MNRSGMLLVKFAAMAAAIYLIMRVMERIIL